jgi:hypothetical protein
MSSKTVWKYLKSASADDVEEWLKKMDYEPYLYDPVLQSVEWVKDITKAIKKVEPLVGDDLEIQYLFWSDLKDWEFILSCFSIYRALNVITINEKKFGWSGAVERLKFWADSLTSHPETRELVYRGTSFFVDVIEFFRDNRKLSDPRKLAKKVLEYKLEKRKK